jgi:chromosome segregation ATPase
MESLKSTFQSQISSLSASLSGKEAEVESLVKAVSNAERRVGEAHELVRDERSAREHAESQMVDWKKKGEEVQNLLHDVQTQLAHNDTEREALLSRLADAEKRAEEAEQRSLELETRAIEAESKNVDMTTFINPDEDAENKKIYSETECQTAIAEKVNEVARDLHSAYKAKHEKKIKALKENYNKKADERCKELRVQIIRLERQVEEAEKKKDDTFSRVLPTDLKAGSAHGCEKCGGKGKGVDDLKVLESQKFEIENLKAKLAGLQSELNSLRKSHDALLQDLEVERVEKGELVAAAEQMLAMCGEKMGEMQQEEMRKSHIGGGPPTAPPDMPMRNTGFLAGGPAGASARPGSAMAGGRPGSAMGDRLGAMGAEKGGSIAKPSGIRGPGGFGFQGSAAPGLSRSISGGKSRIMSNIERMGGGRTE